MIHFGKVLILIGVFLSLVGVVLIMSDEKLKWFGNLPGDFKINQKNFKIFIPLTSMLLMSILINVIIVFFKKFLK